MTVSAAFTAAVFTSLAASFVYLLVVGLRWARCIRASLEGNIAVEETVVGDCCLRCGRLLPCSKCSCCGRPTCDSCSAFTPPRFCSRCLAARDQQLQSGVWFFQELRDRFKSTLAAIRNPQGRDEDVREIIEKLTERLVGGSLDHVQVSQLSSHPAYMGFMERYQGVLSLTLSRLSTAVQFVVEGSPPPPSDEPKSIHSQLKGLIKEIIHEANELPIFKNHSKRSKNRAEDLSTKTYEDILATAILNKIVEKFRFRPRKSNGAILHKTVTVSDFQENSDEDFSEDSIEQDDCWSATTNPFSLENSIEDHAFISEDENNEINVPKELSRPQTLRAPFPELGVDILEGPKPKTSPNEMCTNVESWEENWLFKRKKLRNRTHSPVAMLVPSPNDNVKAQIGDTDADETSDLSDCSETELINLLNNEYTKQPVYLPGQYFNEDSIEDIDTKNSSELFLTSLDATMNEPETSSDNNNLNGFILTETKNLEVKNVNSISGEESLGIEQDSEYTESYEVMEQLPSPDIRYESEGYGSDKVKEPDKENNRCEKTMPIEQEVEKKIEEYVKEDKHLTLPDTTNRTYSRFDEKLILPSVKQLAKHFSGKHNHHKVHSLTARNLARGLQENRNLNSIHSLENNLWKEDNSIGRLKVHSNIEFWEQLSKNNQNCKK